MPATTSRRAGPVDGSAAGYLVRIELRQRRRSIVLLALLTAGVVATSLAALAGARRADTAFERYLAEVEVPDAVAFGDPRELAALADEPTVAAAIPGDVVAISPAQSGEAFFPMMATDGRIPAERFRVPVVQGRLPRATEPLEIALGERTARRLGVDQGDRLTMESLSQEASDTLSETGSFEPDGPRLVFDIVGIVRDPGDIGARETDITLTFLTPAFRDAYGLDVIGSLGAATFISLRDGSTLDELARSIADRDIELDTSFSSSIVLQQANPLMTAIATALAIFAAVAAIAGLATVALAAARLQQTASHDDPTLSALGVSGRERLVRLAAPGALAVTVGTGLGVVGAVALSPLLPLGLARRADPDLGVHFDAVVLVLGGTGALVVCLAAVVGLGALRVRRSDRSVAAIRVNAWTRVAAASGSAPPVVSGLSLATGTAGGPGRAAVGGTLLGALGVVAALTYGTNVANLREDPARYGWGWDARISGPGLTGADSRIAADDDLTTVGLVTSELPITLDGTPVFGMITSDLKGHLEPVMVRGAAPIAPDEVALGRNTLNDVGASIGDTIEVGVGDDGTPMRITGVIALPVTLDGGSSSTGAYLSPASTDRFDLDAACAAGESCTTSIGLSFAEGVDSQTIAARYGDPDTDVVLELPTPPGEIERLTAVEDLPRYLAAFLALLAAAAVSYATATTVRRRRGDLAVLRVLGMTGRQVRLVISIAVVSLTLAGALLGSAGGLVVGRLIWRAIANSVSLPFSPGLPLAALVLVPLAAVVLGQLVVSVTRRSAGRIPAALVLRTE